MRATFSLTNRAMPLISHWPSTLTGREKITAFLKEPHLKNLPPQIKAGVVNGMVFLCHAPDGQRIFLKTNYKRDVIISIRYRGGNVYAELRATKSKERTTECFLVKEGNKIYHLGKKTDPRSLDLPGRMYHRPKIFLKTKSDKIKRGHRTESWLKNAAETPNSHFSYVSRHGDVQICSYNGEPVLLSVGKGHKNKRAHVSYANTGAFKQAFVKIGRKRWEFDLFCERGSCIVRLISEPL